MVPVGHAMPFSSFSLNPFPWRPFMLIWTYLYEPKSEGRSPPSTSLPRSATDRRSSHWKEIIWRCCRFDIIVFDNFNNINKSYKIDAGESESCCKKTILPKSHISNLIEDISEDTRKEEPMQQHLFDVAPPPDVNTEMFDDYSKINNVEVRKFREISHFVIPHRYFHFWRNLTLWSIIPFRHVKIQVLTFLSNSLKFKTYCN